jgi:hypothetical protein
VILQVLIFGYAVVVGLREDEAAHAGPGVVLALIGSRWAVDVRGRYVLFTRTFALHQVFVGSDSSFHLGYLSFFDKPARSSHQIHCFCSYDQDDAYDSSSYYGDYSDDQYQFESQTYVRFCLPLVCPLGEHAISFWVDFRL